MPAILDLSWYNVHRMAHGALDLSLTEDHDLDVSLLEQIESDSIEMAERAGRVLRDHFRQPMEVKFKGEGKTDPVTAADGVSEQYLKTAIADRYPGHNIVSEEGGVSGKTASPFVWVLDPLDGTANFMNGFPFFAVSIGVLWKTQPVVGAIYVPVSHNGAPGVYHARLRGGAYLDSERIDATVVPSGRPLSAMPPGGFHLSGRSKRVPHEVRNTGSIAVELALTSSGVFRYVFFGRPRIWDVAAGVLLVKEAGGTVFGRQGKGRGWLPLDRFQPHPKTNETLLEQLQKWSGPVIAGAPRDAEMVIKDLKTASFRFQLPRSLRRRLGRGKKAPQNTRDRENPAQPESREH